MNGLHKETKKIAKLALFSRNTNCALHLNRAQEQSDLALNLGICRIGSTGND
jgi:hypothetical protein